VDGLDQDIVYGRHAVMELLKAQRPINKVLIVKEGQGSRNKDLIALLSERRIPYAFVERKALDRLCAGQKHQGVLAYVAPKAYAQVEDILALAREKGEDPLILVLDEIEDPHNFGALLRTVNAVGAHGVIIPKRRSVALTGTVAKTSAGAVEHVLVARVGNLVQTLQALKQEGCWVTGADLGGDDVFSVDLTGPQVLVIGSEGRGISRLVREECDRIVSLPMKGKVSSLNASVAGSILLYEIFRQRRGVSAT